MAGLRQASTNSLAHGVHSIARRHDIDARDGGTGARGMATARVATTIFRRRPIFVYGSGDPCGRHVKLRHDVITASNLEIVRSGEFVERLAYEIEQVARLFE